MAIHVELEGKVRRHPIHRNNERGAVERKSLTKVTQEEDASVYVEITEGHPNLDAWSPSVRTEYLSFLAEREGSFGVWEPVKGTWEIDVHATPASWLPTVFEFASERPDISIEDTISYFAGLNGFSEGSLFKLLELGNEYNINGFDVKVQNLKDGKFEMIKEHLKQAIESDGG